MIIKKIILTKGNKEIASIVSEQFWKMFIEEPEGDLATTAPKTRMN